ncbi:Dynein light chain roadblock-type 2 [Desmophyllum pertusum]|uniref:Dynein light chain roadblock n=1 Tax=Desmophyllum pertusum TaxID=174260 RepID=A0A9X0CDJ8_9CNID|nr:Dynein light chain roadblock-type 2 [Desmophyllum pertusum]
MEPIPTGEVEDTLKRINSHAGVLGLIVLNPQGLAIRTTMDNATTQVYASNFQQLTDLVRSCVRDLDPLNDLKFLRVRSRKYEIMVAPSGEYSLIVIQNPNQKDV